MADLLWLTAGGRRRGCGRCRPTSPRRVISGTMHVLLSGRLSVDTAAFYGPPNTF